MTHPVNVHATAIVIGTTGLLFTGPSGSGKSAIARVIERRFRAVSRHFPMFPVISGRIAQRKMALMADMGRTMERTP